MSSGSCSLSSERSPICPSIAAGMTEEQAMAIWLRRDQELEEQRLAEGRERWDMGPDRRRDAPPLGELSEEPRGQRRTPSPMSYGSGSHGSSSSSGRGRGRPPRSGANDAAVARASSEYSTAWNEALARNPLGEYHPSDHTAWMAIQKYELATRPGLAQAYIPSSPGMAQLLEMAREEDWQNREHDAAQQRATVVAPQRSREEIEAEHLFSWANDRASQVASQQQQALESHQRAAALEQRQSYPSNSAAPEEVPVPQDNIASAHHRSTAPAVPPHFPGGAPGHPDDILAAQIREYERLSNAHRRNSANRTPPPSSTSGGRGKKGKKKGSNSITVEPICPFYLATTMRTDDNSKPVKCYHCDLNLYTSPLATNFYCQTCCNVSGLSGEEKDPGTKHEEKMAEGEDYGMQMEYYYCPS